MRDIINIAARRNPYVQLILCPAKVQGEGAAESIVQGIRMLEEQDVDVMIVGRGGGSIEDLWAFNEEIVARAIFESRVPVISAVGHETDTTIADYVADLRAPTPSAAAELAVLDVRQILQQLDAAEEEMTRRMRRIIFTKRQALSTDSSAAADGAASENKKEPSAAVSDPSAVSGANAACTGAASADCGCTGTPAAEHGAEDPAGSEPASPVC